MTWNPLALATALQTVPEQNIDVTNSESALIIKMNDYGDLQINILFTSRQMIIETFICPVSSISNPDEFNTFLLRNQKMMPLSSVGISSVQQEEYYIVFGAGNDSNLLIVFYVQIMPDDFVMQLHRF
ncbi:cytoplasmic protein [Escherichia coli]|nr:hypothetical protein WCM_01714 [Escherichia coli KTE10]ESJ99967.1 hypothetical protein G723_04577 [Escherichia coli HVH 50 (4-2593475)]STG74160.1 cytoplasmic protein [Escherichia coli]